MRLFTKFGTLRPSLAPKTSARTLRPNRSRLGVEKLEDRVVPATHTWTGAWGDINHNWSEPANWTFLNGAPSTGEPGGTIVNFVGNNPSTIQSISTTQDIS